MQTADNWQKRDYQLIDAGDGERLERWGGYTVIRPDPQIVWPADKSADIWRDVHMHYHRSKGSGRANITGANKNGASPGGGSWEIRNPLPKSWEIGYKGLRFLIRPTDFKHMGLFPEQAVNWDWMMSRISDSGRRINVLNLFAYTGGATCACASAGANVCHVDAAKGMNNWAKENAEMSGVSDRVRFITDDVMKFVQREKRRGNTYDAVIMDPPSYGRGPSGEVWKIEDKLHELVAACAELLSGKPLFFLINSYTTGFSPTVAENILKIALKRHNGCITCGEIGLKARESGLLLPCGIYGRWEC